MVKFEKLYATALKRKEGEQNLRQMLPKVKSKDALAKVTDDRVLAEMTRIIFQAGFSWKVIDAKWDGFEAAFHKFNVKKNAALNAKDLQALAQDKRIVRNAMKIDTVRDNANLILDVAKDHGSFARFLANWPQDDLVGLWQFLKENGARLGGMGGQVFLRRIGKDTFILTEDVVATLRAHKIVTSASPTSKKALAAIQDAFNHWHEESGLPYAHLSRILAFNAGKNLPFDPEMAYH